MASDCVYINVRVWERNCRFGPSYLGIHGLQIDSAVSQCWLDLSLCYVEHEMKRFFSSPSDITLWVIHIEIADAGHIKIRMPRVHSTQNVLIWTDFNKNEMTDYAITIREKSMDRKCWASSETEPINRSERAETSRNERQIERVPCCCMENRPAS